MIWIVDDEAEADIASDLSAFHRIDDVDEIDGPRYFSLAQRISAYQGVRAAVLAERQQREREENGGHGSASSGRPSRVSDTTAIAQLSDGWVEHTKSEG